MMPITLLYGALSLLLTWALGLNISVRRLKEKEFSDGGSLPMKRVVKAHRNNVEWVAVLGRALLAIGCLWPNKIRMLGAILTYVVVGGLLAATLWARTHQVPDFVKEFT